MKVAMLQMRILPSFWEFRRLMYQGQYQALQGKDSFTKLPLMVEIGY